MIQADAQIGMRVVIHPTNTWARWTPMRELCLGTITSTRHAPYAYVQLSAVPGSCNGRVRIPPKVRIPWTDLEPWA